MSYQIKISKDKIAKLSHAFKARLMPKYELYSMAVNALNNVNEEDREAVLGLVLSLEKELFDAISEAVNARFPKKEIADFEKNISGFEVLETKKRDLKKSLFLDIVIAQFVILIAFYREQEAINMRPGRS